MRSKFSTTKKQKTMSAVAKITNIEEKIIVLRNLKIILDSDVAELYGVQTKEVNQAVKNNPDKFPHGYVFELNSEEKEKVVKNFDHLHKLKFSSIAPKAFTEKGLYMLATILKSRTAVETTINIIETFTKLRAFSNTISELVETKEESAQSLLLKQSNSILSEILGSDKEINETETSIELNFAVLKLKHTIKRKNGNNEVREEEPVYITIKK